MSEDETVWCTTYSMDINLGRLREVVKDREAWHAAVRGVTREPDMTGWLNKNNVRFNPLQWKFEFLFDSCAAAVISENNCVHVSQVACESFKISSLSLVFCSLNMMCLHVVTLVFTQVGVLWAPWACGLVSAVSFAKFSTVFILNTSAPSFPFGVLLVFWTFTCYTFWNCPRVLRCSVFSFFKKCSLLFALEFEKLLLTFLQSLWFLGHVQSTEELIKKFIFVMVFLIFNLFLILDFLFILC